MTRMDALDDWVKRENSMNTTPETSKEITGYAVNVLVQFMPRNQEPAIISTAAGVFDKQNVIHKVKIPARYKAEFLKAIDGLFE